MNILLPTDSFPPSAGGSGWSTYELARGLRALGLASSFGAVSPRDAASGLPSGKRQHKPITFSISYA